MKGKLYRRRGGLVYLEYADRNVRAAQTLAQNVFEFYAAIGLCVSVLDNDGSVNREPPLLSFAPSDSAGARYHNGALRNYETTFGSIGAVDLTLDCIEQRRGTRENSPGSEYGTRSYLCSFVDAAVTPNQDIILDDYRRCVHWLQNTADLGRGADVNVFAYLSAGADQRV